jgi:hypothetical protein
MARFFPVCKRGWHEVYERVAQQRTGGEAHEQRRGLPDALLPKRQCEQPDKRGQADCSDTPQAEDPDPQ